MHFDKKNPEKNSVKVLHSITKRSLKERIKDKLKNFISSFFPMNDEIIFESHPDFSCNTYALFKYILEHDMGKKFKLTWYVDDVEKSRERFGDSIDYIERATAHGIINKLKKYVRLNRAKVIVCCNRHLPNIFSSKKQLNIYITHGSPIKLVYIKTYADYVISQAEFFNESLSQSLDMPVKRCLALGYPRCDLLFKQYDSIKKIYPDAEKYSKVVVWMPTFRHHKNKQRVDCEFNFPLGIPIFYEAAQLLEFNEFLKEKNILMVFKPHPASDLDRIKEMELSNFRFLYNNDLDRAYIQTNEFLAQTDALITDYSSVYFDYLLLDRPIGITLDDYDEYSRDRGMAYDNTLEMLGGGEHIYNADDMKLFITHLADNADIKAAERKKLKEFTNSNSGHASEAVYDFMRAEIKKRFNIDIEK